MAKSGWIKLNRSVQDCWVWNDEPFSRGQAWIDILLRASHKDTKIMFSGNLIDVERGSFITSILGLSEYWRWSRNKTRKFLEMLQNDAMIDFKSDSKKTYVKVLNYCIYQDDTLQERTTEGQQKDNEKTSEGHQKDTIKNIKNIKNYKNEKNNNYIYVEIVAYLNEKAGTNFRSSSASTQRHINARLNEGYTVDDFKKVIDNKVSDWKSNDKMSKYLAPDTLFSNKFEKYLQEKPAVVREGYAPDIDPKWLGLGG